MENRSVREIREGGKLPTLSSSPLIKIRVFNWSKSNYYFSLFYSFLFILALWLFSSLLFYQESITCQHAPRLLLVVTNEDRKTIIEYVT